MSEGACTHARPILVTETDSARLSQTENRHILVMIPTYNERDNVEWLYRGLKSLELPLDYLFVDDNSPDGTGKLLDELAAGDARLFVLHREGKFGIGSAHKTGIEWAYERRYRLLVTMDADLTHSPKDIPRLLEHIEQNDVVVGSRYLQPGSLAGWNLLRRILTRTANFLTTWVLELKHDATGAFRLYRLDSIPIELFRAVKSDSYSFFFESLYLVHVDAFRIHEIPIALPPRTYGTSKMKLRDAIRSINMLFLLYFQNLIRKKRFVSKFRPEASAAKN